MEVVLDGTTPTTADLEPREAPAQAVQLELAALAQAVLLVLAVHLLTQEDQAVEAALAVAQRLVAQRRVVQRLVAQRRVAHQVAEAQAELTSLTSMASGGDSENYCFLIPFSILNFAKTLVGFWGFGVLGRLKAEGMSGAGCARATPATGSAPLFGDRPATVAGHCPRSHC